MLPLKETAAKYLSRIEKFYNLADRKRFGILSILRCAIERFVSLHGFEGAASVSFFATLLKHQT